MTGEGREAAAAEEMGRAREELAAAGHLVTLGFHRVAMTRTYYAAFHAARAALYREGLEPRTHQGALRLFSQHFVKTGRFEPAASRLLARLQRFREEADYGDTFIGDEAGAREELEAATSFVERIGRELGA